MLNWDIRSVVLSIAAIQAIIISALLLIRNYKTARLSDRLLAFFLLAISATMSEHIAGWLGLYQGQWLTFFPFGETFLFAPLAYLYVKSITNSSYVWSNKERLHFTPAFIYFIIHMVIWSYPVQQKLDILNWLGKYHWYDIQGYGNALFFTLYLYKIIRHFRAYLKWLPNEYSNIEKLQLHWMRNFILLLSLYYFVFIGFNIASAVDWYNYNIGFWQYFVLAVIIYYTSVAGYGYVQKYNIAFDLHKAISASQLSGQNSIYLAATEAEQINPANTITSQAAGDNAIIPVVQVNALNPLKTVLLNHLQQNKPYLDAELSLSQLAHQLEKPPYIITQVINIELGKNFNDLINSYRVDAVVEKLKKGEQKTQTLLGIAYDCGFNSKATFNRAFKKAKNISPKEFIETL